jgi:hypothetical protein
MTILGIKVDMSQGVWIDEYAYYTVDINEDDNGFWDYYEEMRRESNGFVEDYRRSNQHYPKFRNIVRSSQTEYDSLTPDRQLVASWVWIDVAVVH